jgi:methylmalonic acid semialdehyde dehydrogenase
MEPEAKKAKASEPAVQIINNYIGGRFVPPVSGAYLPKYAPKDGQLIAQVALSGASDVDAAVQVAQAAFLKWGPGSTVKKRMDIIFKFNQLVREHADELCELIILEHGKTYIEAQGDLAKGLETVEYACSMPQLIAGRCLEVSNGIECKDIRDPLGVVASIVPFNFPFMVPMWTLPIAISVGNCLILKPSEKVPMTMTRTVQLLKDAGLPDGVVQLVHGAADAVTAICDHPGISAVSFVGSSPVAQIVQKRSQAVGKRVLALGGAKNHLVALPDCNVDACAEDIVNSFTGCAGQRCMAASILLVLGDQPQLISSVVTKSAQLTAGRDARNIGPIIDQPSLDKIIRYINEAEQAGCKILLDGRPWTAAHPSGHWIGPTIILQQSPRDPAMTDEIFGPVLSIYPVKSREEAIAIENGNPYGNAACVYTTSGAHANWFTSRFGAGMLGVNIGVPVPREPFSFGGINRSKFGDYDITADGGIEFFTKRRKITTKWTFPAKGSAGDWMS